MGCYGNPVVKTPTIDRLASMGVQFNNGYCNYPVSGPSRASFLTGLYPQTTTILDNRKTLASVLGDRTTLPALFKQNGYQTMSLGKVFHGKSVDNDPKAWDEEYAFGPTKLGETGERRNIGNGALSWCEWMAANGYRTEYYGKWHAPYQFASNYRNEVKTTNKDKHAKNVQSNVEAFRKYLTKFYGEARKPANGELTDFMSLRPYKALQIDGRFGQVQNFEPNGKPSKSNGDSQANNIGIFNSEPDASLTAFEGHEALTALKAMKTDELFSLTCSFGHPHPPFIIPKEYAGRYDKDQLSVPLSITDNLVNAPYSQSNQAADARFKNAEMAKQLKWIYYSMVTQVDDWVGKLLDELDRKGIANNTLVVFVSDHGEMLGDHGLVSKNKMYEGSVHVPMLMRYPKVIPAGKKVEAPVSHHDIFATILDYTRMKTPQNDGRSLRKLIDGKKDSTDYAVSVWGAINNGGPFMIRKDDWKMIVYLQMNEKKNKNVNALYNLKTDPLELTNLIGANPDKAKYEKTTDELKQTFKGWMNKTNTPYIKQLEAAKL